MTTWNLKQASLLDASGELTRDAQKALHRHLSENPTANREYESTLAAFRLLQTLPIPEPSAAERRRIPARIKHALGLQFAQMKLAQRARKRSLLIRYALTATAAVAAGLVMVASIQLLVQSSSRKASAEQTARVNALVNRVAATSERHSAYDQALTDVEASIRQLQTESPTLASVHDQSMSKLLDALATIAPDDNDDYLTTPAPDSL